MRLSKRTEVQILILDVAKKSWITQHKGKCSGLKPSDVFGDVWRPRCAPRSREFTHEKLQRDVVHEDVVQRDNAQLAKVGCQL